MLNRRELLATSLTIGALGSRRFKRANGQVKSRPESIGRDRIRGILLGSMIGDALGGPIEFQKAELVAEYTPNCRGWQEGRQITGEDLTAFANSLKLISYGHFRPNPEPYGQWSAHAPPGTITDDTRHKMVLMNTLRKVSEKSAPALTESDLAQCYVDFAQVLAITSRPEYRELCEESFREFWKAARWVLGERDLQLAAPPDRIWGGTPTCCGQMTMLPLAAIYPGRPDSAYRKTYELSFFDIGAAKDINSAIVSGLSIALTLPVPKNRQDRRGAWKTITEAMRETDPYQYEEVPFVQRPTVRWLNFAQEAVKHSQRRPKRLYQYLEDHGEAKYFWESHFILSLVFSAIEFCDYDPLAAMALILDFGHDTDSGAQLLGAFVGAIYGPQLFPEQLQEPVITRLREDYDVDLNEWTDLLQATQPKKWTDS